MPKLTNKLKTYYLWKIGILDKYISNATSPEQKARYEEFRQTFVDKLPKTQNPDIITAKALEKEKREIAKRDADREVVLKDLEAEQKTIEAKILQRIEDLKKLLPEEEEVSEDNGQITAKQTSDD